MEKWKLLRSIHPPLAQQATQRLLNALKSWKLYIVPNYFSVNFSCGDQNSPHLSEYFFSAHVLTGRTGSPVLPFGCLDKREVKHILSLLPFSFHIPAPSLSLFNVPCGERKNLSLWQICWYNRLRHFLVTSFRHPLSLHVSSPPPSSLPPA